MIAQVYSAYSICIIDNFFLLIKYTEHLKNSPLIPVCCHLFVVGDLVPQ